MTVDDLGPDWDAATELAWDAHQERMAGLQADVCGYCHRHDCDGTDCITPSPARVDTEEAA